jgi:protocatechuate 3,4-dioxygenase beta subunit
MLRYAFIAATFAVFGSVMPRYGHCQADPSWLRSWNEAQRNRPEQMRPAGRIAGEDEPGQPLVVRGQIVEPDGRTPARDIVVHAYHRDAKGFDFGENDRELTTWRLQGWAKTDAEGRFEFRTIRPAADYMGRDGAHIHFTLESPQFGRQWAPTIFLADDAAVSDSRRAQSSALGEFGSVREVEQADGGQRIAVKFRLKERGDF